MSQYEINRSCGHRETVNITGTNVHGQREQRAARLATQPCADCRRDGREVTNASVNAAAAEVAADLGWPALTGSDRQVAWAQTLRADVAGQVAEFSTLMASGVAAHPEQADAAEVVLAALDTAFRAHTEAAWWIDHAGGAAFEVLRAEAASAVQVSQ